MYTQVPGKHLKENKDRMMAFNPQLLPTPLTSSNPNIRMQPLNFAKMNQQPPNGFISYSDFTRPSAMTYDQNRRSQVSSSSIKTGCTTQESIEVPGLSLKDLMVEKLSLRGAEVSLKGAYMKERANMKEKERANMNEKERVGAKSTSSKLIMDRPPGKPMYRQVTVRYF